MTILELPQGYYADLTGMSWDDAMQMFQRDDAAFVAKYPSTNGYHRPCWREFDVEATATAPFGHEWYLEDEHGLLKLHSAHYDSSG